jgi:hypothetical protein
MSDLEIKSECTTLIKWKVTNFSTVASRDDPNKELWSDKFKLYSSGIKCRLRLYPTNKKDSGERNCSSFSLHVIDFDGNCNIKLRCRFWIENELGDKTAEGPGKHFKSS